MLQSNREFRRLAVAARVAPLDTQFTITFYEFINKNCICGNTRRADR